MALSWLSDIADLGQFGVGIYELFRGEKEPEGLDELLRAAEESRRYLQAATNPDDPMFQKLAAQEEAAMTRDFTSALRQIQTQNRRALARGQTGVTINPERRDEMISRNIAAHKETVKDKARANARNYLLSAAGKNQVVMQGFGAGAALSDAYNANKRANRGDLWRGLFTGLGQIGQYGFFPRSTGMLDGNPNQTDMRNPKPLITESTGA